MLTKPLFWALLLAHTAFLKLSLSASGSTRLTGEEALGFLVRNLVHVALIGADKVLDLGARQLRGSTGSRLLQHEVI